jgi:hypothetical protein
MAKQGNSAKHWQNPNQIEAQSCRWPYCAGQKRARLRGRAGASGQGELKLVIDAAGEPQEEQAHDQ